MKEEMIWWDYEYPNGLDKEGYYHIFADIDLHMVIEAPETEENSKHVERIVEELKQIDFTEEFVYR